MRGVSVVIITHNESLHISDCIASAKQISDDIIVVDAGSNDDTVKKASESGVRVMPVKWENFGSSRNTGADVARYPWVLSLDADERIGPELAREIMELGSEKEKIIYGFRRESFFAGKKIRFGTWGRDRVYRLYHKHHSRWDTTPVHEKLIPVGLSRRLLLHSLIHYPVRKERDFIEKIQRYAVLMAQKYLQQHKNSTAIKRWLAPAYVFLQSYFLLLGFLDGKEGLAIARHLAWYTRMKYRYLEQLQQGYEPGSFGVEI